MTGNETARLQVVSRDEWRQAREALLAEGKEATRTLDALAAKRRRRSMVEVELDYTFQGPDGTASFVDPFDGRRQLILYHFMFDPDWNEGRTLQ